MSLFVGQWIDFRHEEGGAHRHGAADAEPCRWLKLAIAVVLAGAAMAYLLLVPGAWRVPVVAVPFLLLSHLHERFVSRLETAQRQSADAARLHFATIEALARAIDAKEAFSGNHPRRVQLYAARLSQALGLGTEEVQGIKTAAVLHDIGKLAVPEHILSKTGPLTSEELEAVKLHSRVGADLIAGVPFTYPVASVILSHHERWDGGGYPSGLREGHIPLGSRILAVVDCFDSILSARPHHRGRAVKEASDLLRKEAGRALDPQLVAVFLDLLPCIVEDPAGDPQANRIEPSSVAATRAIPESATDSVFENIAQAHREVYALYEIAQSMRSSLGVVDTMALLSNKMSKIVPWSACSLFLYERSPGTLRCAFGSGIDAPRLVGRTMSGGADVVDWQANLRRTLVNVDPQRTFDAAGLSEPTHLRSEMSCPLYFDDEFVGVFSVYHVERERYSEDHRRLFERVADQAGTALHNVLVFAKTREEALTDSLTGLPNRRWLNRYLPQELARAERPLTDVALISIDVDGFKMINDRHGHDEGDRALRAVANALLSVCRPYDVCARLAGDEFVVVLPNCSRESAEARRDELQERVRAIELFARSGARLSLGASAGVAVFPTDGRTDDELLDKADHRMYADKSSHRLLRRSACARNEQFGPSEDAAVPVRHLTRRG